MNVKRLERGGKSMSAAHPDGAKDINFPAVRHYNRVPFIAPANVAKFNGATQVVQFNLLFRRPEKSSKFYHIDFLLCAFVVLFFFVASPSRQSVSSILENLFRADFVVLGAGKKTHNSP